MNGSSSEVLREFAAMNHHSFCARAHVMHCILYVLLVFHMLRVRFSALFVL